MMTRRMLFKKLTLATGSLAIANQTAQAIASCFKTPKQPEGPFYPVQDQLDKNTDLTLVNGHSHSAQGEIVYLAGVIMDGNCQPVKNARIEIWQACASGRYNHPGDISGMELDEHFQYWGIATTGPEGLYKFKTILPGAYPAGEGWIRPPHIHIKGSALGFHELITQVYFEGNPLNDQDLILKNLSPTDRARVIVKLQSISEENAKLAKFDITMERVV